MSDLIYRKTAIDGADLVIARDTSGNNDVVEAMKAWKTWIKGLPAAQTVTDSCDSISRKAAIDRIVAIKPINPTKSEYTHGIDTGLAMAMVAIKEQPAAQPEQRWIPMSERPPKVREWVLCQCRAGIMDVLRLTDDGCWSKSYPHVEYMSGFVIARRPLPAAYREGDADATLN